MPRPRKNPNDPKWAAKDAAQANGPSEMAPRDVRPKATTARVPKVTRDMVEALVTFVDFGLRMVPALQQDALEDFEKVALIDALYHSARTNKFLAAIIVNVTRIHSQGQLVTVSGCIIARRLAIHHVVPVTVGAGAEMMLMMMANTKLPNIPPQPEEVQPPPPNGLGGMFGAFGPMAPPETAMPASAPEAEPAMNGAGE